MKTLLSNLLLVNFYSCCFASSPLAGNTKYVFDMPLRNSPSFLPSHFNIYKKAGDTTNYGYEPMGNHNNKIARLLENSPKQLASGCSIKVLLAPASENAFSIGANFIAEWTNNLPSGATLTQGAYIDNGIAPIAGKYDGYDLVIFGGNVSTTINAGDWSALQTAIINKTSKAFIIDVDWCCNATNRTNMNNLVKAVFGTSYTVGGTQYTAVGVADINPSNTYSSNLSLISKLDQGNYYAMGGIANADVLYFAETATGVYSTTLAMAAMKQLPGATGPSQFLAWFADGTPYQSGGYYTYNQNHIAPAFYSYYTGSAPICALPLTLVGFSGSENANGENDIVWEVGDETDISKYNLYHSTDAVHFDILGSLDSKSNGNSGSILMYNYTDKTPSESDNYYRIGSVDYDGKETFYNSIIIKNRLTHNSAYKIYPIPATNNLKIDIQGPKNASIQICNSDGNTVLAKNIFTQAAPTTISLPMQSLPNGVYFVKIIDNATGGITVKKITKQ